MDDLQLTRSLLEALERGERAVLCAVVESSGSAPRGPGARMAVLESGEALGTVGGGAVERLVQNKARGLLEGGKEGLERYTLGGEGSDTGMVCGGAVTIWFKGLEGRDVPALRTLESLLWAGRPGWLILDCRGDRPALAACREEELPKRLGGRSGEKPELAGGVYTEPVCRDGVLYLFGAGHVGQALAPVLTGVGFRVVVYDSREDLARRELFPGAFRVICSEFDRIGEQVTITPLDYVVVMTPGHAADLEVLCQALSCRPRYVGCLGSRKKRAYIRQTLAQRGFSQEQIGTVHLPIGLSIGAETPAEIAVSVAAELIQFRAEILHGGKSGHCPA